MSAASTSSSFQSSAQSSSATLPFEAVVVVVAGVEPGTLVFTLMMVGAWVCGAWDCCPVWMFTTPSV